MSEDNEGNIEYKLKLVHPSEDRLIHLTTQMKYRLQEGNGEAIYEIGVEDNGNPLGLCKDDMKESLSKFFFYYILSINKLLETIYQMSSNLKADAVILSMKNGYKGKIAEILVRKNQKDGIKIDIRIVLMGEEDSGKSTLV